MANYCEYKVIVKGKRNACYAFFGSMSCVEEKGIVSDTGSDEECTLKFEGNCKWSVDAYCTPWAGEFPVALPDDYRKAYEIAEQDYWYNTVAERSKMFEVEVWCNSADVEDYDEYYDEIFEHYLNGEDLGGVCPNELRIGGDWAVSYPVVISIEGAGYEGRTPRIEQLKVGDPLIIKADYENPFYSPVAIEVFNEAGETLGYLKDSYSCPLTEIGKEIDSLYARAASVTTRAQRGKRARNALLDVEILKK